jgi:hypothetical protein
MIRSKTSVLLAFAAALAIAAAVMVALVLALGSESAGPEAGVTLDDVVEDPARYDGQTITVSGEWAENRYFEPGDASVALVIGDDSGKRLLVIPQLGTDVPRLNDSTVLEVRGTVHMLAEDETAGDFVEPGGILASQRAAVVLTATRVSVTPPPRVTQGPDTAGTTIEAILADPRAWDGQLVEVTGEPRRTPRGFMLSAEGRDIFVSAPEADVARLPERGEVRVQAKVQRLSAYAADTLERAFETDPPGVQPGEPPVVDRLPIEPGEPYLLLRQISP